jgi:basic membrane lipoprotein Med (substrate-binding protein (PBP1-ABC) superfamily)
MGNILRPLTRHPRLTIGTALVAAAGICAGVLASSNHQQHTTPPIYTPAKRARTYSAYSACLLTGPNGITDAASAPVWSGMQSASDTTRAQVSYLPLQGPQTASNAADYINALAMRGCELILTAGTAAGQGAADRAAALPHIEFITVDAPAAKAANLTVVSTTTPSAIIHAVTTLVTDTVNKGGAAH